MQPKKFKKLLLSLPDNELIEYWQVFCDDEHNKQLFSIPSNRGNKYGNYIGVLFDSLNDLNLWREEFYGR